MKSNNILIGIDAELYLTTENGVIIIGDNIKDLIFGQKNVLYLAPKILIGSTLNGKHFELNSHLIALLNGRLINGANNSKIVLGENA